MRVVFIGAVQFSRDALRRLAGTPAQITGVCTLESSTANADHVDLAPICRDLDVPWRWTPDINSDETLQWIRECQPDVIFCFGWSRLLRRPLLDLAPMGVVGFHPAALPQNRGRHPLIWALALGLPRTASTFFFMDESADGGDILSQRFIDIDDADDAGSLYRKVTDCALEQIVEFVPQLASRRYPRIPQDASRANSWRKRGRADGQIDWRMSARSIRNLVHAGRDVKVWRAEILPQPAPNLEPGKVLGVDSRGPVVACGEQAIRLVEFDDAVLAAGEYL
jgi:methionyl-tRNA formyltransferase